MTTADPLTRRTGWGPAGAALLFVSALTASLFFHGFHIQAFGLTQVLLLVWLVRVAWQAHAHGFSLPKTAITISLTLLWAWLALTLIWAPVPYVSTLNFWWIGTLPLAFWLYTLAPDRAVVWMHLRTLALLLGLALALMAIYQGVVLHQSPSSVFLNINSHAALLNLIALPTAGYFMIAIGEKRRGQYLAVGLALFVLMVAIVMTQGRAAILSFGFGIAVLLFFSGRQRYKQAALALLALIVAAFIVANLTAGGEVLGRLQTLQDPRSAGATRFIIWQQSWEMLKAAPWLGIGLGTYSLAWPAFRHPADDSAGNYVHNDYLQLWIEAGAPALMLLLAVFAAVMVAFLRFNKKSDAAWQERTEASALLAALIAIALHSFFDFNLYIIAITLLAGIVLGRLHDVVIPSDRLRTVTVQRLIGAPAYKSLVVLVGLLPISYFAAVGLSGYVYEKALRLAEQGELQAADEALLEASRLAPQSANILMTHADLYRHLLEALPSESQREREALFTEALATLARAEKLNPFQVQVLFVRGRIYEQNSRLTGEQELVNAIENYERALALNPRFYAARVAYAQLLLKQGRERDAKTMLEEGLRHWYFPYEAIVPYYALTAKLRLRAGDARGAKELIAKIEQITPGRTTDSVSSSIELIR